MNNPRYQQKEMIYDIAGGHNEVMVVELNAQCALLDIVTRRFAAEFPETWKEFMNICVNNDFNVGSVSLHKEHGITIAILQNVYYRVGPDKDVSESIRDMTLESLRSLIKKVGRDKQFISGYIGPKDVWGSIVQFIKKENLNWIVYRE